MELYNYRFLFKNADGDYYKLRAEQITSSIVHWRFNGTTDSFTETLDFNLDENGDGMWVRLPSGKLDIVINVAVEPLRIITTSLQTLDFAEYSATFEVVATPVPLYSMQGFSPRIIDEYWHQYDDTLQAFVNTGIKAAGTVISETTEVVDRAEQDNQNPITSNAVYNIVNEQNIINETIESHFNDIERQISDLGDSKVSIKLNGDIYQQDPLHVIDLGEIKTDSAPNTHMLTEDTLIDGTWFPKGTEVDDDNKVYATDSFYRYRFNNKSVQGYPYKALLRFYAGCSFSANVQVFNNSYQGQIYVSLDGGYRWNVVCTNPDLARYFKLYYQTPYSAPILVVSATVGIHYVSNIKIVSDTELSILNVDMELDESKLESIKSFLVDYEHDTIEINKNNYTAPDLHITDFICTVGGDIVFDVEGGLNQATDISFAITAPDTKIIVDGVGESRTLQPGEVATLIYQNPDNFYWTYTTYENLNIHDVLVDNVSCCVAQKAYIYSLTDEQMQDCINILTQV